MKCFFNSNLGDHGFPEAEPFLYVSDGNSGGDEDIDN